MKSLNTEQKTKYLNIRRYLRVSNMEQLNLKLPDNLLKAAKQYVENFGFRNVQELAAEAIREKIFKKREYDENFTNKEIDLIDNLASLSIKKKDIISEEELNKILTE